MSLAGAEAQVTVLYGFCLSDVCQCHPYMESLLTLITSCVAI